MTLERYSRQILFPGIGESGQSKIQNSSLAVIGCGALGSVSSEMFVRAGVGRISLIDRDFVEESNLQRQSLFRESDAASRMPKAEAARVALGSINSDVEIQAHVADLNPQTAELLDGHDLLVDGTDNFATRYLINDYSCKTSTPWCYAGCVSSHGISFLFRPGVTPCLRCFVADAPPPGTLDTCDTAGIIAPAVHVAVSFQVTQVLKWLVGEPSRPCMLQFDVWSDQFRTIQVSAGPAANCPCCIGRQFSFLNRELGQERVTSLCGRNAVQVVPSQKHDLNLVEVARRLGRVAETTRNEYLLRVELPPHEITLFPDGRAIIKGTDDQALARTLYDRYIGR